MMNIFRVILRSLSRNKFYTSINILGLSSGFASVLLIVLFISHELSYDKFHQDLSSLYRVLIKSPSNHMVFGPVPLGNSLQESYPEITSHLRVLPNEVVAKVEERVFYETGAAYVDGNFFEFFSFSLLKGSPSEVLKLPNSVVIDEEISSKYFGDENPIGKTVRVGNDVFQVSGLMEKMPRNSHIQFSIILPFQALDAEGTSWGINAVNLYVSGYRGTDLSSINAKVKNHLDSKLDRNDYDLVLQPIENIHLSDVETSGEPTPKGSMETIRVFSVIAVLLMLVASVNFINLTTAKSSERMRVSGIKKILGARRNHLVMRFLGESLLLSFTSLLFAFLLADLALPIFKQILGYELRWSSLIEVNGLGFVLLLILLVGLLIGILAGIYPALYLSSMKPSDVIGRKTKAGSREVNFRSILVLFQFCISILLVLSTLFLNDQFNYLLNKDLGIDKEGFLLIPQISDNASAFKAEVESLPGVTAFTSSDQLITKVHRSSYGFSWEGELSDPDKEFSHFTVDSSFVQAFGLEFVDGGLSQSSMFVIINEEAQKVMGYESATGKTYKIGEGKSWEREFTISGVVKDFHFKSLHERIPPLMLIVSNELQRNMLIRVNPNFSDNAISQIEEIWTSFNPGVESRIRFLENEYSVLYLKEKRMGRLFMYFCFLALLITCIGLLGLVTFGMEQKSKEISVRKVLGASVGQILLMVNKPYVIYIFVGLAISAPICTYLYSQWLSTFAYHTVPKFSLILGSAIFMFLLVTVVVSAQSLKFVSANPIKWLRSD